MSAGDFGEAEASASGEMSAKKGRASTGSVRTEWEPPSQEASADKGRAEAEPGDGSTTRIQSGHNREAVIVRYPKRKLFNRDRKKVFLEWFAATANLGWAAEKAGVCRQTVSKHLMSDPEFAGRYEDALKVSRLRLNAKLVETRKPEAPLEIDCEIEAPDLVIDFDKGLAVLREMEREVTLGRRQGRMPRVASNAELLKALAKRVKVLAQRVRRRGGEG